MSSDDTQRLIAKDKQEHPNCDYSVSTSKSCRESNGKMECATLHRVLRHCPGDSLCEIFRNTLKSGDAPASSSEKKQAPFEPGGGLYSNVPQLEEHFKDMHRLLESFGGGLFGDGGLWGGAPGGSPFHFPDRHHWRSSQEKSPPSRGASRAQQSTPPSHSDGKPRGEVTEV